MLMPVEIAIRVYSVYRCIRIYVSIKASISVSDRHKKASKPYHSSTNINRTSYENMDKNIPKNGPKMDQKWLKIDPKWVPSRIWSVPEKICRPLVRLGRVLEASWSLSGHPGRVLGASRAVPEHLLAPLEAVIGRYFFFFELLGSPPGAPLPPTLRFTWVKRTSVFSGLQRLLTPSGCSKKYLGPQERLLARLGRAWTRLGRVPGRPLAPLGTFLGRFYNFFRALWTPQMGCLSRQLYVLPG